MRPKYVFQFSDSDRPDELRIVELPPEALPKAKAAPGLMGDVIVSKLVDHLPPYRQEQRYVRQGFCRKIHLFRESLASSTWPIDSWNCASPVDPTFRRSGEAMKITTGGLLRSRSLARGQANLLLQYLIV